MTKDPLDGPFGVTVEWSKTGDGEFPYTAQVDGQKWLVRVNDWPEEPTVFTLLVDGKETLDFDGWSELWTKP